MSEPLSPEDASIVQLVNLVLELGTGQDEPVPGEGRSFTRTQILLQAMSVFNQLGLEATAVQDILDAAQISRRTFYKYFSGKLDVLESIYVLSARVLLKRIETELRAAESLEQLCATVVTICFDYQFSLGHIIALMMEEAMRSASPLAAHRMQLQQGMRQQVEQQLRRLGRAMTDAWLLTSLLLALEAASLQVLRQTTDAERPETIRHCREQMVRLWVKVLE